MENETTHINNEKDLEENKRPTQVEEIEELIKLFERLRKTPSVKKFGGDEGLWNALIASKSLKLDPCMVLKDMNVVRGKVELSVHLMSALIRSKGHFISKDKRSTDECCILKGKRRDTGEEWETSFSLKDAARAGLLNSSPTWKAYPKNMLYARAFSILARELFADVIGGTYIEGEISDSIRVSEECVDSVEDKKKSRIKQAHVEFVGVDKEVFKSKLSKIETRMFWSYFSYLHSNSKAQGVVEEMGRQNEEKSLLTRDFVNEVCRKIGMTFEDIKKKHIDFKNNPFTFDFSYSKELSALFNNTNRLDEHQTLSFREYLKRPIIRKYAPIFYEHIKANNISEEDLPWGVVRRFLHSISLYLKEEDLWNMGE